MSTALDPGKLDRGLWISAKKPSRNKGQRDFLGTSNSQIWVTWRTRLGERRIMMVLFEGSNKAWKPISTRNNERQMTMIPRISVGFHEESEQRYSSGL